jgi:tungstate transport system substrate-binding protein
MGCSLAVYWSDIKHYPGARANPSKAVDEGLERVHFRTYNIHLLPLPDKARHLMLKKLSIFLGLTVCLANISSINTVLAAERSITVASTTSTESSGLFAWLLPKFTGKTGIDVHVVAVGTGAAIRHARKGDADVLLVHHMASEKKFVEEGFGVQRYALMWNDFVLIGPSDDPAGVRGQKDITKALKMIHDRKALFVSRGDDSGTHKKEMQLWQAAALVPQKQSGTWYREIGAGMGAALNMAAAQQAYVISDRGTWLRYQNAQGLTVLSEGDDRLVNPYGVILVNKKRHAHVKADLGQTFIDWLLSGEGQSAIGNYRIGGKVLFHPGAAPGS